MPAPMDDNDLHSDLRRYIEAFADGELDVETNLRVLERMAMNPQATQRVMHQQELRKLVDRAMREQSPPVPADLRSKIMAISKAAVGEESARQETHAASSDSLLFRLRRWIPAVAAMLLLTVGIYLWSVNQTGPAVGPLVHLVGLDHPVFRDDLLESGRVTAMGTRHESCSTEIQKLYKTVEFSADLNEIPKSITKYLGPQIHVPRPDLTKLGYEYRGAGACTLPGGKAVHLVYQPIGSSGRADALSLWIRSDETGQVKVEEGRLYTVTPEGSLHPVLVWRRGSAVYYLVGEPDSLLTEAADTLYASR